MPHMQCTSHKPRHSMYSKHTQETGRIPVHFITRQGGVEVCVFCALSETGASRSADCDTHRVSGISILACNCTGRHPLRSVCSAHRLTNPVLACIALCNVI